MKKTMVLLVLALMCGNVVFAAQHHTRHKTATHAVSKHQKVAQTAPVTKKSSHTITSYAQTVAPSPRFQKTNFDLHLDKDALIAPPNLASAKALVVNQVTGEILYAKNTDMPTPIASVTKLMTAMVMLDAHLPMDEYLTVTDEDVDTLKGTHSRLQVGTMLPRADFLQLAIMSSENRAASVLGRNYPGGLYAFVQAMNQKARSLGMTNSRFVDSTGLNSDNMSTAEDLVKMVKAAYTYPQIREASTTATREFSLYGYRNMVQFNNTNPLVREPGVEWSIGLSKTGFINEAGRCLVMQAEISGTPVIMILLDSSSKNERIGDAQRVRKWLENGSFVKHLG